MLVMSRSSNFSISSTTLRAHCFGSKVIVNLAHIPLQIPCGILPAKVAANSAKTIASFNIFLIGIINLINANSNRLFISN